MLHFEVAGFKIGVIVDNDKLASYGIQAFIPSAVVDRTDIAGIDGIVYTTTAFTELSENTRRALLTHEVGHIACGHLELDICEGDGLVVNETIEAEADAWAVTHVGMAMFDRAVVECGNILATTLNADAATKAVIKDAVDKRIANRHSLANV